MKVGVVTFHNAHNYGASLQTWALQKVLKNLGTEPGVIHYHPNIIDKLYVAPKLDTTKKKLKYMLKKDYRSRIKSQVYKNKRYNKFIREKFHLIGDYTTYEELLNANLSLDAYITGSDQVWNSDHTGGFDPAYTLDFAKPGTKKISYAASVGREYILPQYREQFRQSLESYTAISVREPSAQPAIEALTEKPVEVVLDPTLLLEKKDYEELKRPGQFKGRYIMVYMMEANKELVQFANRLSVAIGLPIIQRKLPGVFRNELGSYYEDTAAEFLGEIEKAEYVITNSFHATVFSLIYEKPFISMLHTSTGARTSDLLKSVGLESHLLYHIEDFHDMKQFEIDDVDALRQRIRELRASSLDFLKRALEIKK
ncbi:polysaccharide pyruvyl transferase family protein [Lachnoclostridium phytofermentans]|jgi:polysaccharide pyruvyl transferase WcaK-like protein|uniref:polysaccharide pyruvyl transferase family protein n=1 Tax=Lachnoclostridium phytofermentans TaxID=66219 RepID=UPI000495B76E|nr:polysaccharide pyruvyl transferase family protein [Lachnoclostridium phytofermentans]